MRGERQVGGLQGHTWKCQFPHRKWAGRRPVGCSALFSRGWLSPPQSGGHIPGLAAYGMGFSGAPWVTVGVLNMQQGHPTSFRAITPFLGAWRGQGLGSSVPPTPCATNSWRHDSGKPDCFLLHT